MTLQADAWLNSGGSKTGIGDIFNNNYSPVFKYQFRIRMTKN